MNQLSPINCQAVEDMTGVQMLYHCFLWWHGVGHVLTRSQCRRKRCVAQKVCPSCYKRGKLDAKLVINSSKEHPPRKRGNAPPWNRGRSPFVFPSCSRHALPRGCELVAGALRGAQARLVQSHVVAPTALLLTGRFEHRWDPTGGTGRRPGRDRARSSQLGGVQGGENSFEAGPWALHVAWGWKRALFLEAKRLTFGESNQTL